MQWQGVRTKAVPRPAHSVGLVIALEFRSLPLSSLPHAADSRVGRRARPRACAFAGRDGVSGDAVAGVRYDWNDLSRVKDGMAIIAKGDYWTSATNMFDGNIASFPDGHNGTLIGVDLGTNYVLSFARAHPRYNDGTYSTWTAYGRLHSLA